MLKDKKIIFVHGYTASPEVNFYPPISKMLDEISVDYAMPYLPGHKNPRCAEWLKIIDEEVKKSTKPVILVGHSLGTIAILNYLDQYESKVSGILLVAAFDNDYQKNNRLYGTDFFEHLIDIDKIKKLSDKFVVMHSKDDSDIDFEEGKTIAKELDAELLVYDGRDHFQKPENAAEIFRVLCEKFDS